MEDELKWMTPRKTWKYIPNRYQALVAQIVAALLYFNLFNVVFMDSSTGECGSLMRPRMDGDGNPRGWIFSSIGGGDTYCSQGFFSGLIWQFIFTSLAIAICGVFLRNAIKRMPSEHREATKYL